MRRLSDFISDFISESKSVFVLPANKTCLSELGARVAGDASWYIQATDKASDKA